MNTIDRMTGIEFENIVAKLISSMGLEVEFTKASGDGGIDLIAYNNQPLLRGKYIIQCKRWDSNIGEPILRDLYGVVMSERANKGILITNSSFTKSAKDFSENKPIELIDGEQLKILLKEYNILDNIQEPSASPIQRKLSLYDEYIRMKNELAKDKDNYRVRCKLIEVIMDRVFDVFYQGDRKLTFSEMEVFISDCRENIKYIYDMKDDSNYMRELKIMYKICDIQMYILEGKFIDALKASNSLLENKYFVDNERFEDIWLPVVKNTMQLYNLLGLYNCSEKIYYRFKDVIESNIDFLESSIDIIVKKGTSNHMLGHYRDQLDKIKNYKQLSTFILCKDFNDCISNGSTIYNICFERYYMWDFQTKLTEYDIIIEEGMVVGIDQFPRWSNEILDDFDNTMNTAKILF